MERGCAFSAFLRALLSVSLFLGVIGLWPHHAVGQTVTGANGTQGAAGQPGVGGADGTSGGDGGAGESITQAFNRFFVDLASIWTIGGNGGSGGVGGAPNGAAGSGGVAGDATTDVRLTNQTTNVNASPSLSARAEGGTGGAAGRPGAPSGTPGIARDGGAAVVELEAISLRDKRNVGVGATALGGRGGNAYGVGQRAGTGGSAIATATATATDATQALNVQVVAVGGDGGVGFEGADGGDGAFVALVNAIVAAGAEILNLTQYAKGGDAGPSNGTTGIPPGQFGRGGDATSSIDGVHGEGDLRISVWAEGGGASGNGRAGNAFAGARGTAMGDVAISATSIAGRAGTFEVGVPAAPVASAALGPVFGRSTGGGSVAVSARLEAGNGGASRVLASDGGDAILSNAVDGETTGPLTLSQTAVAGHAGPRDRAPIDAPGSRGGDARSELNYRKSVSSFTAVVASVAGWSYGRDAQGDLIRAGEAISVADVSNDAGALVVDYQATGGLGGRSFETNPVGGPGGDATATIRATTVGDGQSISVGQGGSFSRGGAGRSVSLTEFFSAGDGGTGRTETIAIAQGNSRVDVEAHAIGGTGGSGLSSRVGDSNGTGGLGIATARGSNAGNSSVNVLASATGGEGGGYPFGGTTGDGGDGGTGIATAHGESSGGGAVTVTARVTGGGATEGGVGGAALVENAVSGRTTGTLRLVQHAIGGHGNGQRAGSATSLLGYVDTESSHLIAESIAEARNGLVGGTATASASVVGAGHVDVSARVLAAPQYGGTGTPETASRLGFVRGESTGGGDVSVTAELGSIDFQGALVGTGDGNDAVVVDAVDGSTTGRLGLVQRALASSGRIGAGGLWRAADGVNQLTRTVRAGAAEVLLEAQAANGGFGTHASRGGDATVGVDLTNETGAVHATVIGRAGAAGSTDEETRDRVTDAGRADTSVHAVAIGDHAVTIGGGAEYGAIGGAAIPRSGQTITPGGGTATSRSVGEAVGDGAVAVRDRAIGGQGGRGGDATSHAEGHNQGASSVFVLAEATGGAARDADGSGGRAHATARGTSISGDVTVETSQRGGDRLLGMSTSAETRAIDTVTGSTSGRLTLIQRAIGSVVRVDSASGSVSGSARSDLTGRNEGGGALSIVSEAVGGRGFTDSVAGGGATASAHGIGDGDSPVEVLARARGGDGFEFAHQQASSGADGGRGELGLVYGESAAGGDVHVRGEVYGGAGARFGGRGADAIVDQTVDGATTGRLWLVQTARAGAGGRGGDAMSRLVRSVSSAALEVLSEARGGDAREAASDLAQVGEIGFAGSATSEIDATNDSGGVAVDSLAIGGIAESSATHSRSPIGVPGGNARSSVTATTEADFAPIRIGRVAGGARSSGAYGGDGRGAAYGYSILGGRGGDAESTSIAIARGNSTVEVDDHAEGGDGASGGEGGRGGSAVSHAEGSNTGSESVRVAATAIAGAAGAGSGPPSGAPDAPGTPGAAGTAHATAVGHSDSGDVHVSATQRAGNGGGSNQVAGLSGSDSVMIDAARGSTRGLLQIDQFAAGGNGGGGDPSGRGGDAHSEITQGNLADGALVANLTALAGHGTGTSVPGAVGGQGGHATAAARIVADHASPIQLTLEARGGNGGGTTGGFSSSPTRGGDGGEAVAPVAEARSTVGGAVGVSVSLYGGNGGVGSQTTGSGMSVSMIDVARGTTSGDLALSQRAFGGDSGAFSPFALAGGTAGRAGDALSSFDVRASSRSLHLVNEATGGHGRTSTVATGSSGGSAASLVRAHNDAGGIRIEAAAVGGSSFNSSNVSTSGGRAEVDVLAETQGDGNDITIGGAGLVGALARDRADAHSRSIGVAYGASSSEVWDRAVAGGASATSGPAAVGGNATSVARAESTGGARSLANAFAEGGTNRADATDPPAVGGLANARATATGGLESIARAESRAGLGGASPLVTNSASSAFSFAEATGLASVAAEAVSIGRTGRISTFGFDTSAFARASSGGPDFAGTLGAETRAGGDGRQALDSNAHSAAAISGAHSRDGEWGRISLALDRRGIDDTDIVLEANASLINASRRPPVSSFDGVFVSFLQLDLEALSGGSFFFRIESGGSLILEETFVDDATARAFFATVLDIGELTGHQPLASIDLRFTLGLAAGSSDRRVATYLAIGTTIIPEPGTATLVGLGLIVIALGRRRV